MLALPAAMLIAFAFAGAGIAATTFMRSWTDFDFVNLALIPMFLFAATFFPLSQYPTGLQWVVRCTPLYQGVALERGLTTGQLTWTMLLNVAYLAILGPSASDRHPPPQSSSSPDALLPPNMRRQPALLRADLLTPVRRAASVSRIVGSARRVPRRSCRSSTVAVTG